MFAFVVLVVVAAWRGLRALANTLLDRWWLDTVTDAPVWSRRTAAELQVGLAAAVFVAAVLGTSVWIVLRVSQHDHGPLHRFWRTYHERVGPAHRWALVALATYLVWHIGWAGAGQWRDWLLFRYGGDLGVGVPELGGDLGFYLFRLPLLLTASSFVRQLLVLTIIVAALGHGASGALRTPRTEVRSSSAAVLHLALLGVAFLAAQALHEVVVARAATATNRAGTFDGPGFTEVNVTRPALVISAALTVLLGFAIVRSSRSRRWRGTTLVAAGVAVAHVAGLVIAPIVSERLLVAPSEAARQLWSIEHNLTATRSAYGLDEVGTETQPLTEHSMADPTGTGAPPMPLFSVASLTRSMQVLVGTPGTRITDVDLLPYEIDGTSRPVATAARASQRADLPERGWVQEHLVYTHGDGVVAFAADVVDENGRPDPTSLPGLAEAEHTPLYFGEGVEGWYVLTSTRRTEIGGTSYDGEGVAIGSPLRRLTLALATGEPQPILSGEITENTLLLYRRGIRERINAIAPFLTLDSDPYLVVDGDRAVWVVDAYTTAATYPYSQFLPTGSQPGSARTTGGQNYVRASVRATVDASDGTVHLYRTADDDPVLDTWNRIFPGLLDPVDDMPPSIRAHLRYPGDYYRVQTSMLGRYHVEDPEELFAGGDRWAVSPAAATTVGEASGGPAPAVDVQVDGGLAATTTFGPGALDNPGSSRDELAAIAVAKHGPSGEIYLVRAASNSILGPQVAQSAIDADPDLAQAITLLNANGSHVEFGPMTPIIRAEGVTWARPITVIGTGDSSVPRLYAVAVVSDGVVSIGPTLDDAIARLGQRSLE